MLKLGGSLLDDPALPALLDMAIERASAGQRLVVVPGGGPFADTVRRVCATNDPGDDAAHWMAILAMDQYAHWLVGIRPASRLVHNPDELVAAWAECRAPVLAPFTWLRAADPLPRCWEATSDSVAAWVADQLDARTLILLKSVEGVHGADGALLEYLPRSALGSTTVVDGWFARALQPETTCWIVSGRHPERLRELLVNGATKGTRVG